MDNLSTRDLELLRLAVDLGRRCPPVTGAFSVGAVVAMANGEVISTGFSREIGAHWHAEELALLRAQDIIEQRELVECHLFSSLEPCSRRSSHPRSCCELIVRAGIRRVVFCLREPEIFAPAQGRNVLRDAGITTLECPSYSELVRITNAHVLAQPVATSSDQGNRQDL